MPDHARSPDPFTCAGPLPRCPMDKLKIAGGRPLAGEVADRRRQERGAADPGRRPADVPSRCTSTTCRNSHDIGTMARLLRGMGVHVERDGETVSLHAARLDNTDAPYELVKTMRASILVLGPLVARFGEARVSLPGGCAIGARPVDQHSRASQAMGAEIAHRGRLHRRRAAAAAAGRAHRHRHGDGDRHREPDDGRRLADGTTVIENAAREPEVVDLANCLIAMGAQDRGRRHRPHHDRGRRARCTARATRHARPHRGRHLPRARRRPAAAT